MSHWLRRLRGAIGMGVTWAAGWAVTGLLIGASSLVLPGLPWDVFFDVFDAPLPALAVPGFVGGTLFSLVLGVAGRRRRFEQLSLPRVAAWGALGGVLLSLVPAALVGVGMATVSAEGAGVWTLTGLIVGPLVLLSTLSATGSLLVARRAARPDRQALEGGVGSAALGEDDAPALLEGGEVGQRSVSRHHVREGR